MNLLPRVRTLAAYRELQPDRSRWLPAMRAICDRHGLPTSRLQRLSQGTNVVFTADDFVLKLFPPHWTSLAAAERAVLERVDGQLPVATPRVHAHGSLEQWPYLVMSRLPGEELHAVWPALQDDDRTRVVASLGELVAAMHRVPSTDLSVLDADWSTYVSTRLRTCVERHHEQGLGAAWLEQIPAFLAASQPLYPPDFVPVIVTGDTHDYHLLVEPAKAGGGWRLCGLFDFDDARLGFREYDLAAAGLFLMSGQRHLLRTFLLSYGYSAPELNSALSRRLLAYTLLHPYREMTWVLSSFVDGNPSDLDELASTIYRLT